LLLTVSGVPSTCPPMVMLAIRAVMSTLPTPMETLCALP
jgi:hypothetical protein